MKDYPTLQNFFSSKGNTTELFKQLDADGNDEVTWSEFLVFLEKIEMEPNVTLNDSDFDKFFRDMKMDEEVRFSQLVRNYFSKEKYQRRLLIYHETFFLNLLWLASLVGEGEGTHSRSRYGSDAL